jgi:hypothetical protein
LEGEVVSRKVLLALALGIMTLTTMSTVGRERPLLGAETQANAPTPGADAHADLGNSEDETFHNLQGWGVPQGPPANPYVSPSGDRTKRYQLLRGLNSIDLSVQEVNRWYALTTEVEDGSCTDNFNLFVNDRGPIYSYIGHHLGNQAIEHLALIPPSLITSGTVKVTFENTATDDCGGAAVYNVSLALEPDSDGDGLLDRWESPGGGVDINNDGSIDLHLAALGASPWRRDIFVEVDYMDCSVPGSDCLLSHSHHPNLDAIDEVVLAFSSAPIEPPPGAPPGTLGGVALHVQIDEALTHVNKLHIYDGGTQVIWQPVFDIKQSHFGTPVDRGQPNAENVLAARHLVYRYALFIHDSGDANARGVELGDFVVSLGSWYRGVGSYDEQAGGFMHELGHSLGLGHGGADDDDIDCKPNYLSVMNESRTDRVMVPSRRLDYSPEQLPTLNESSLDEGLGIQGPEGQETAYGPRVLTWYLDLRVRLSPTDGPIDWDADGVIEGASQGTPNVQANINDLFLNADFPACNSDDDSEILTGHDDWGTLKYAPPLAGASTSGAVAASLTFGEWLQMAQEAPDHDTDGVPTAQDNCPLTANPDQSDNDSDGFAGSQPGPGDIFGGDACDPDDDNDGCTDGEELGDDELQGGQRDALDPWDFYDVPTGDPPTKNRVIDLDDAFGVLAKFGTVVGDPIPAAPPYDPAFDRTAPPPERPWATQAPEGVIDLDDFFWAIWQFGHSCYPPP